MPKKVSFDFDNSLRNHDGSDILPTHEKLKKHLANNDKVIIVTRRHPDDEHSGLNGEDVKNYVKEKFGDLQVIFTDSDLKWETLEKEGISRHYDDDINEIKAINNHTDIEGVLVKDGKGIDNKAKDKVSVKEEKKETITEVKDAKDAVVLFYDYGNYLPFICSIANQFKKVYYFNPNSMKDFPMLHHYAVGYRLPEIEMITDDFKVHNEIDLFIFPDLTHGGFQCHLENEGRLVWGSKCVPSKYEVERDKFKEFIKSIGLPVNPYKVVKGIKALQEYLKENKNVWVKLNKFRGLTETFNSKKEFLSRPEVNKLRSDSGLMGSEIVFVVEDTIKSEAEIGYDGFFSNEEFPDTCLYGVEIKDVAYCGKVIKYEQLPKVLKDINEKMKPMLIKEKYCNTISTEVRMIDKDNGFFIDPAMRFPSPPGEIYPNIISNLGEFMFQAALGRNIKLEFNATYGMQAIIWSQWSNNDWNNIEIPEDIKPFVKIKNLFQVDGKMGIAPPMKDLTQIGSIVATGSSIKECIKKIQEYAEKLEGIDLVVKIDQLDKAIETLAIAEKYLIV